MNGSVFLPGLVKPVGWIGRTCPFRFTQVRVGVAVME